MKKKYVIVRVEHGEELFYSLVFENEEIRYNWQSFNKSRVFACDCKHNAELVVLTMDAFFEGSGYFEIRKIYM